MTIIGRRDSLATSLAVSLAASSFPLCQLHNLGLADQWGPLPGQTDGYQMRSCRQESLPAPEQVLDCACGLYLNDPTAWQNERTLEGSNGVLR